MPERDLIKAFERILAVRGGRVVYAAGDDAAVVRAGGAAAVTSVDAIVEGVHFELSTHSPGDVGHKALAAALSDLAAMGAAPGEVYVILGVPPDLDEEGCLAIFEGVAGLAAETGAALAGGDITRSPVLSIGFTVVGHADAPERLIGRAGARPGDHLVLTGELGGAAAGLLLLERPELGEAVSGGIAERLRRRLRQPIPRLAEGLALAGAGARAMIDLSDGLGADAGHVAAASGVLLTIDVAALPLSPGVAEVAAAAGEDPLRLATAGGEDYELLASVPEGRLEEAINAVGTAGTPLVTIGEVAAGEGVELSLPGGRLLEPGGFDQLR